MRGVRIQSIVRELNDEKIDVIEWDPNQIAFIAKALSPARVSHVFLEDHPENGKTAVVIVPDDQLSLAIGREGQNARLAAKLTGWRIDIKSLTESAADSLNLLDDPQADESVTKNTELLEQVGQILAKKEARRPITSEDYYVLNRLVSGVEGRIIGARAAEYEELRKQRVEAKRNVPEATWELPIDVLDLPGRVHNLLLDNEVNSVGDVLYNLILGDDVFLSFSGFGEKGLETLKEYLAAYQATHTWDDKVVAEVVADEAVTEVTEVGEALAEEAEVIEEVEAETAVVEPEPVAESESEEIEEPVSEVEEEAEDLEPLPIIEDLSQSLVEEAEAKPTKKQPAIVVARKPTSSYDEEVDQKSKANKGKALVFDEKIGQVVTKRKRKGSRRREEWDEFEDEF
jgi:N utilization substance protein A